MNLACTWRTGFVEESEVELFMAGLSENLVEISARTEA